MGLLRRKKWDAPPKLPTPTKISSMSSEEIWLFIETSLMMAQHQLTEYRSLPQDMRMAALTWMQDNVDAANVGIDELYSRLENISPQT